MKKFLFINKILSAKKILFIKKISPVFLIFLFIFLFSACSKNVAESGGAVTVTDMVGREVSFEKTPSKIVALTASDCEILFALGAGDLIVGRGTYCNYPPEALEIAEVQSGETTNIEQISALAPDAVVLSAMAQTEEQVKTLESLGIKCVTTHAQNIEEVYVAIELLGKVVDKNSEAKTLIDQMKKDLADVSQKAKNAGADGSKTIYFEITPLVYGLWTAGTGTFMDEIAELLGVANIFDDVAGWGQISEEQVIERNPDYIVSSSMNFAENDVDPVSEIKSRAGWNNIKAILNDGVTHADSDEITRPGPRLANAAKSLYSFIYE
jgi:iron complex transport system substrate-binding protein